METLKSVVEPKNKDNETYYITIYGNKYEVNKFNYDLYEKLKKEENINHEKLMKEWLSKTTINKRNNEMFAQLLRDTMPKLKNTTSENLSLNKFMKGVDSLSRLASNTGRTKGSKQEGSEQGGGGKNRKKTEEKYKKTGKKYKESRNNIYVKGKVEYVRQNGEFISIKKYEKKK